MSEDELSMEQIDVLMKTAGHHQEPLRVTYEFYSQLRSLLADEIPVPSPYVLGDPLSLSRVAPSVGFEVVVVSDGTENVRLIDGAWTFVRTDSARP